MRQTIVCHIEGNNEHHMMPYKMIDSVSNNYVNSYFYKAA